MGGGVGSADWDPLLDMFCNELGSIFRVGCLIQSLIVLTGSDLSNLVKINPPIAKLGKKLGGKDHSGQIARGDQIELPSMGKLPQPEVVCLLVQQGGKRKMKRVTSFNVQFASELGCANDLRKGQAIDLLVVVVVVIPLPLIVQIKTVNSGCITQGVASAWCGWARRRSGTPLCGT